MFAHKLPINIEDLLHQRRVKSERIEYKESWNPEAVLHSICAFANDFHNLGSGYIIIGVPDQNTDQDKPASGLDFPAPTDLDTVQATVQAGDLVEKTILRLLEPLQHEPLSVVELLDKLSIRHRASFRTTYLVPALTQNLVEMTLPDKPKSPNQKYRLTAKGRALLQRTKAPR